MSDDLKSRQEHDLPHADYATKQWEDLARSMPDTLSKILLAEVERSPHDSACIWWIPLEGCDCWRGKRLAELRKSC